MKKAAIAVAVLSAVVSGSTLAATVYDAEGTSLKVGVVWSSVVTLMATTKAKKLKAQCSTRAVCV